MSRFAYSASWGGKLCFGCFAVVPNPHFIFRCWIEQNSGRYLGFGIFFYNLTVLKRLPNFFNKPLRLHWIAVFMLRLNYSLLIQVLCRCIRKVELNKTGRCPLKTMFFFLSLYNCLLLCFVLSHKVPIKKLWVCGCNLKCIGNADLLINLFSYCLENIYAQWTSFEHKLLHVHSCWNKYCLSLPLLGGNFNLVANFLRRHSYLRCVVEQGMWPTCFYGSLSHLKESEMDCLKGSFSAKFPTERASHLQLSCWFFSPPLVFMSCPYLLRVLLRTGSR